MILIIININKDLVMQRHAKINDKNRRFGVPLLQKEKTLDSIVRRILPKTIADSVSPTGSRLAHLYGLPKTHKEKLAMRPILSATDMYNYPLAKWLDEKLKPLSLNQYTVTDTIDFTNDTLHNLDLTRTDLVDLLSVATKGQLFQFDGALYEQTDGFAMGSPPGPLLANVFMSSIEDTLERQGKLPSFYRQYVDDTLTVMPDLATATTFLHTLNSAHTYHGGGKERQATFPWHRATQPCTAD